MTRPPIEIDPRSIRLSLDVSRAQGVQFDTAWDLATKGRGTNDERTMLAFMRKHFRAAYTNDASSLGRCLVPEIDTSNALLFAQHSDPSPDHKRCRSGDDCDREAVRGRFGRTFCERHGAELERIGTEVQDYAERHNPRKHSNASISRAAA